MNKLILRLSVPFVITSISIPLLGLVDMMLMGHQSSDSYIGAIAIGTLIFNFIYWGLGFLRMGTSGFTAQARGRKDLPEIIHIFTRAIVIAAFFSVLLLLLQRPVELLSFKILKSEEDVRALAISYFRIRIWAAPAALGQFAFLGFFLGMQNARIPMTVLISTNLVNIIFNYFFVMVLGMKSDGVALGTVIAQYFGLFISLFFFYRKFNRLFKYWSLSASLEWNKLKNFLKVNQDIFIRTMCLVIVFSFFTANSSGADLKTDGEKTILAVNSLLMQFFMFFSFLIDGFAHSAEALSGRFIGARDAISLKKLVRILFYWGTGISLVFTLLFLLWSEEIFRFLTNNKDVIANARPYFFWVVMIPVLSFASFLWDGIFIGATAGKEMRNAMLLATIVVFFPAWCFLEKYMGNHALWFAFILFTATRSISMSLYARKAVFAKVEN